MGGDKSVGEPGAFRGTSLHSAKTGKALFVAALRGDKLPIVKTVETGGQESAYKRRRSMKFNAIYTIEQRRQNAGTDYRLKVSVPRNADGHIFRISAKDRYSNSSGAKLALLPKSNQLCN